MLSLLERYILAGVGITATVAYIWIYRYMLHMLHCHMLERYPGQLWCASRPQRHQPSRTSPIWQTSSLSDGSLSCQMAASSNVRLTHLMSDRTAQCQTYSPRITCECWSSFYQFCQMAKSLFRGSDLLVLFSSFHAKWGTWNKLLEVLSIKYAHCM